MRKNFFSTRMFIIVLLCITVVFIGCQTKAKDLSLGVFSSTDSCVKCHSSSTPEFRFLGAREGYNYSGHKNGYEMHSQNSYYANGGGCQLCHTNEGFTQYMTTGSVDADGYIDYPSQIGCFTCHDPHNTADFSVRTTAVSALANKVEHDFGKGNLCTNCHRARSNAKDAVKAMPAKSLASYFGPHHGPEADVLAGTNAFHFDGKSYSNSAHTDAVKDSCVSCHMALPEGRYSLSPEVGGHSFSIAGEVHEAEMVNLSACTACHPKIGQVKDGPYYNKKAEDDYDQDGTIEPVQLEVKGLLEMFVNDKGTGVFQKKLSPPLYKPNGDYDWRREDETEKSVEIVAALYNYKLMLEDRSLGVHNTIYTVQVLYDSLESIDPAFDTSKRPSF